MKPILRWIGGKSRQWKWIGDLVEGEGYREYCVGGGAMLCRRQPTRGEGIGDVNSRLVGLYRVVKNEESCWELMQMIASGGEISKTEFDKYVQKRDVELGELWNSYVYLVLNRFSWMSHGWQYDSDRSWGNMIDRLKWWNRRLRGVRIDCANVLERRWTGRIVFLDPPYLHSRRVVTNLYEHEMTTVEHIALLERAIKERGKRIIICGVKSELYESYLKGWNRRNWTIRVNCGKESMDECVWWNELHL